MIHGMWGGGWYWENYERFFQERGYHCVATTLRHHDMDPGGTPDPRLGRTSLLDYAEDLEAEIRQLGVQPIVMGHSMGGLLAQILGSRGLAKALVLLTPAPPAGVNALKPSVLRSFWRLPMRWVFWKKPTRQTFNDAVYATMNMLPPAQQRETHARLVCESGRAAAEIGLWPLDTRKAAHVDESKVTCPVLIVGAAHDRVTPVSVIRQQAKKYAAVATYKEFPDNAHWVVGEPGWEEIAQYVSDWLDQALNGGA